jgi:hypothetical protein
MKLTSQCNDRQLQVLLRSDESFGEFRLAQRHVDTCDSCQYRLTELAATPDQWEQAKTSLFSDADDAAISREQLTRPWSTGGESTGGQA